MSTRNSKSSIVRTGERQAARVKPRIPRIIDRADEAKIRKISIIFNLRQVLQRQRQVAAHTAVRSDSGLQSQVGSAAGVPFKCVGVGGAAQEWRLGVSASVVVPDNLGEGVLAADIYDPRLNPLYRDVLADYGVTAVVVRRI
jgi:hypothetical protein